LVAQ